MIRTPILTTTAGLVAGLAVLILMSSSPAAGGAQFSSWEVESYPAVSGLPSGTWVIGADEVSVTQIADGQPSVFLSPFDARNHVIEGRMRVNDGDDDFFGFVVGFEEGDSTNPAADFLLIDWKRATQTHDFGDPSCTLGTTADVGMAISHVLGVPTADELWGHANEDAPCSDLNNGVKELARAPVLGNSGWTPNNNYFFRVETTSDRVRVYVNNSLQIDHAATIPAGSFGFYVFSQSAVAFTDVTVTQSVTPSPDPTPPPATPTPEPIHTPSPTPEPDPTTNDCDADINGDGAVTAKDVAAAAKAQPSSPGDRRWNPAADVNHDGEVDHHDVLLVVWFRGTTCSV